MMLRWNAVLLLLVMHIGGLHAGEPLFVPHSAGSMGMAFAVTATPGYWNCFHNQALLADAPSSGFSITLENRYMMPAMSSKAISAIMAFKPSPLGLVVNHYGNADYYRLFAAAGSAVRITEGIAMGIQVDYIYEHGVGEYPDVTHVTFEAGLTCLLSPSLTAGFHLFNPLTPLNTLPSSAEAGLYWKSSDSFGLALTGSKASDEPLSVQCGLSWDIMGCLTLRSGYKSSPSAFAFGLGFRKGPLQADAGFLLNTITGLSSSISVIWTLK